jgi:AmmeMemoRadiSam system protein A
MSSSLTGEEKQLLLRLAREAVECATSARKLPPLDPEALTPALAATGASFVTLTKHGQLRGCLGALDAYQSLAEDVREHAIGAALQDFRFPPVQEGELPEICIEVSRLTTPFPLEYATPEELLARLRPGVDGVILSDGPWRRATFLPQVWEKLPDPAVFLDHLCEKMGLPAGTWRVRHLAVKVYEVEEFEE